MKIKVIETRTIEHTFTVHSGWPDACRKDGAHALSHLKEIIEMVGIEMMTAKSKTLESYFEEYFLVDSVQPSASKTDLKKDLKKELKRNKKTIAWFWEDRIKHQCGIMYNTLMGQLSGLSNMHPSVKREIDIYLLQEGGRF